MQTSSRRPVLPPGAKPGDAVTLNGEMTLPIGLDVEDVANNFTVTLEKSTDPNLAVLKLVPINKAKFSRYSQLEITVDKTLQLPVKLVQVSESVDTTIFCSAKSGSIPARPKWPVPARRPATAGLNAKDDHARNHPWMIRMARLPP